MPPLMQNSKLLLICTRHGCNPCTKFGIDQVKGSKDIERTTHWARKSGLTLTFEHVTWKSIGIIYLLRATSAPSLILFKWRGQKILSRHHTGLERVIWPWPLNMWLLIEGNPCTKFDIVQVKGSKDIERTTLGLQTDRHTDRQLKTICPLFQGGHKNKQVR